MQIVSWLKSSLRPSSSYRPMLGAKRRRRSGRISQQHPIEMETLDPRVVLSAVTVTQQDAVVSVDEGRAASNYGYINSNEVSEVTASIGTLTFDAQWQLWQWTYDTADGPADSCTVEITATDINGNSGTTSFLLNVNNVNPSVFTTTADSTTYQGITFEAGDVSFADSVVDSTPGPNSVFLDAAQALGAPTGGANDNGFTLGNGGSITLQFSDNAIVDQDDVANGADLVLFDLGLDAEEVTIEISTDGTTWLALPNSVVMRAGEATGVDISSVATAGTEYQFVRITDVYFAGEWDPFYVGLDLDAVGAIAVPASVTVNGGETATREGVFGDPGTDIVSVTASIGTITQSGASSGEWYWSHSTLPADAGTECVTITATDADGGVSVVKFDMTCIPQVLDIDISISGGAINLSGLVNSRGATASYVQVAIYSTNTFNARDVNLSSVIFAGAHVSKSQLKDVDGDGDLDLVAFFKLNETNLLASYKSLLAQNRTGSATHSFEVTLTAETNSGAALKGEDTLQVFASGKALRELLNSL